MFGHSQSLILRISWDLILLYDVHYMCTCTYMRAYILMYVCMHAFIHENVYIFHTINMIVALRSVSGLVSVHDMIFWILLHNIFIGLAPGR